jgi:transposase
MGDSLAILVGTEGGAPCPGARLNLWTETQFIADYLRETLSVSELCDLYAISRNTAYKWIERYLRQGPAGLKERSRKPQCSEVGSQETSARGCQRPACKLGCGMSGFFTTLGRECAELLARL